MFAVTAIKLMAISFGSERASWTLGTTFDVVVRLWALNEVVVLKLRLERCVSLLDSFISFFSFS